MAFSVSGAVVKPRPWITRLAAFSRSAATRGSQSLQRLVGVDRLVGGVAVDQRALLLEDGLAQQGDDALALGEPLPAQAGELFLAVGLVEKQEAGGPAVGEAQPVEVVEQAGPGRRRKAAHRQHPQVRIAQHRLQAAGERLVGQQRMAVRRHRPVEVGQRLGVIEPRQFGQEAVEEGAEALGLFDEAGELFAPVDRRSLGRIQHQGAGAGATLGRREEDERQEIGALEQLAHFVEGGLSLLVDQPRNRIRKCRAGIGRRRPSVGFDEQRPARAETAQSIVKPGRDADEFALGGTVEVGAAEARRALERAILIEQYPRRDQAGPRQVVGEVGGAAAVFGEVQHHAAP
jgi:hypothetical protein